MWVARMEGRQLVELERAKNFSHAESIAAKKGWREWRVFRRKPEIKRNRHMAGKPPVYRMVFKHIETGNYMNEYEIPFWESKHRPDLPPSPRFPKGTQIFFADGTVLKLDEYYTNLQEVKPKKEEPDF